MIEVWDTSALIAAARDPRTAKALAETVFLKDPLQRDVTLLRDLAGEFPSNLRLGWILYQTEAARSDYQSAAKTIVALARRLS